MSAQNRFGHVNVSEIIQSMPEYSKAQSDVDSLHNYYEAELNLMQEELQKKALALEKEKDSLPENIKQSREKELEEMYQKIQQSHQDIQQTLQKVASEKMQSISSKVLEAIKAVGKENDFLYILDINKGDPLYINTKFSTDVTSLVKTKLGLK